MFLIEKRANEAESANDTTKDNKTWHESKNLESLEIFGGTSKFENWTFSYFASSGSHFSINHQMRLSLICTPNWFCSTQYSNLLTFKIPNILELAVVKCL